MTSIRTTKLVYIFVVIICANNAMVAVDYHLFVGFYSESISGCLLDNIQKIGRHVTLITLLGIS